jgi:hypothetical protein
MVYGTYGLVSVSKRKPGWLIKILGAIVIGIVLIIFLIYWYF